MNKIKFTPELEKATGEIEYNMTNDYMFRALFQKNNNALKGLLSALLHMQPEEILSVEITIAKDNEQKDNTIENLEKISGAY